MLVHLVREGDAAHVVGTREAINSKNLEVRSIGGALDFFHPCSFVILETQRLILEAECASCSPRTSFYNLPCVDTRDRNPPVESHKMLILIGQIVSSGHGVQPTGVHHRIHKAPSLLYAMLTLHSRSACTFFHSSCSTTLVPLHVCLRALGRYMKTY